ncbi:hypothetical protein AAII07_07650 [Microvirga sp. 0TCS3.31]
MLLNATTAVRCSMESSRVYVTTGSSEVYHSSLSCRHARMANSSVKPRELRGLRLRRCTHCWEHLQGFDLLAHEVERLGDSTYEVDFVARVLRDVRGLRAHDVTAQKEFTLSDGRVRRVDFFVDRGDRAGLVIELDGYDKSRELSPAAVHQQDKAKRRELEAQFEIEVVDFANLDLADPAPAISDIERRLRSVSRSTTKGDSPAGARSEQQRRERRWLVAAAASLAVLVGSAVIVWQLLGAASDDDVVEPVGDGNCPTSAPIKGNVSAGGEKIFHAPGWEYYGRTAAEECFESEESAVDSGYRASEIQ